MPLAPGEIERILAEWPVARLATLDASGAPHQVPITFACIEGRFYSPVDGKPKRDRELARLANVRRDPRVSLLLDHWDADWTRLWWIRIDGRARVVGPDGVDLGTVEGALRSKYPQYAGVPVFRGVPVLLEIECSRVTSWSPHSLARTST